MQGRKIKPSRHRPRLFPFGKLSKLKSAAQFSFLIDSKEMPIDKNKQTVVAREQKYIDRKPSLDNCKMLCFGHVAAHFLSKRFYILDTCVIFHEIMFFKELSAFIALYFIQGALFPSWRFYFIRGAFIFLA